MVEPKRAPVEPRVFRPGSTYALPLVDEIRALLEERTRGAVAVFGPPGSGKTTALAHLAAVLPADENIVYFDEPRPGEIQPCSLECLVVHATSSAEADPSRVGPYRLAPWTRDELLEYLVAVHKCQCGSVMSRLPARGGLAFDGSPDVWRIVLDRMAGDASIPDAQTALSRHVERVLGNTDLANEARRGCLELITAADPAMTLKELRKARFIRECDHLIRHRDVQLLLAAEQIVHWLGGNSDCGFLRLRLPAEVVRRAGAKLTGNEHSLGRLKKFWDGPREDHAMAASLLLAADKNWAPERGGPVRKLAHAFLSGARWPGAELSDANLAETDLSHADLHGSLLDRAQAGAANLQQTDLREACLWKFEGLGANLAGADMAGVHAQAARFIEANLEGACLSEAFLKDASFRLANLIGVDFRSANLTKAVLLGAKLTDADFSGADLSEAVLTEVSLRDTRFTDACLPKARLERCDLEDVNLDRADCRQATLEGALLTGTSAEDADFSDAILRETGLAEVNWERAILRGADLSGATFHMGTTRSGLVDSPIASEGSRTGFYTDDYEDRYFKAPEEIRKANLRGADLRDARIDHVDFYLVDLRDAFYDPDQAEHFRRSGAILEARV
jgi:uncharacterized protein YjbI with pentapeptide repeats